jgi:hypothetical protein
LYEAKGRQDRGDGAEFAEAAVEIAFHQLIMSWW